MDPEPTSGCQAGQLSRGIWRTRLKKGLSSALPEIEPKVMTRIGSSC